MSPPSTTASTLNDAFVERLTRKLSHSVPESATLLNCSPRAVYNLIEAGKLRSFKHGRKRQIATSELLAYIERQMAECS